MPTVLQLPFHRSTAKRVGDRTFLKRLLPLGELRHPRESLRLDREALAGMVREFAAGTVGQVPVMLGRTFRP